MQIGQFLNGWGIDTSQHSGHCLWTTFVQSNLERIQQWPTTTCILFSFWNSVTSRNDGVLQGAVRVLNGYSVVAHVWGRTRQNKPAVTMRTIIVT
jgi:hypothetical protein